MMDTIDTPRLRLLRMHDTSPNSQHVQWLHRLWTDKVVMSWSLHGPTSTLQESRDWLAELLDKYKLLLYIVFIKDPAAGQAVDAGQQPGELIGFLSLGQMEATLPPPAPPRLESGVNGEEMRDEIDVRTLGYAYREAVWGKGYATEAARGLLDAYAASVAKRKKEGGKTFYVEGTWGRKNPASGRILTKLGMKEVGWKEEEEPVFLGGEWQEPGYWVYGMYV